MAQRQARKGREQLPPSVAERHAAGLNRFRLAQPMPLARLHVSSSTLRKVIEPAFRGRQVLDRSRIDLRHQARPDVRPDGMELARHAFGALIAEKDTALKKAGSLDRLDNAPHRDLRGGGSARMGCLQVSLGGLPVGRRVCGGKKSPAAVGRIEFCPRTGSSLPMPARTKHRWSSTWGCPRNALADQHLTRSVSPFSRPEASRQCGASPLRVLGSSGCGAR